MRKPAGRAHGCPSCDVCAGSLPCAGLLESPSSWLHQLVGTLPSEARLQLFGACKQLARQVILSAPNVTLKFCKEVPADTVETRRISIFQLLDTGRKLRLVVGARGPQPFPVALNSQVTELQLKYGPKQGPASPWLKWSALTNMQHLSMTLHMFQADIDGLCDALEAGHLQQLHTLTFTEYINFHANGYAIEAWKLNIERLARALGPRVKTLRAYSGTLMSHVQHLTALQAVTLPYNEWFPTELALLANHPTLQTVKLDFWQDICHDYSKLSCTWHTLHLVGICRPKVLFQLPLANVPELRIQSCIFADLAPVAERELAMQGLRLLINRYLSKVSLLPDWDSDLRRMCFKVRELTADTISVVRALRNDCWLVVERLGNWSDPEDPMFLPALWAALHPSVSSVRLHNAAVSEWHNFWAGIPATIKHLEIHSLGFSAYTQYSTLQTPRLSFESMYRLVAGTPKHVKSLKLFSIHPQLKGQWEAAGIHKATPHHLQLELTSGVYE